MDTKQVILELRTQKGMSQDELAEKVFVILSILVYTFSQECSTLCCLL